MSRKSPLDKSEIDRLNRQALSCLASNRAEAKRLTDIALAAAEATHYERGSVYAQLNQLSLLFYAGDIDRSEALCEPLTAHFHALGDAEGEMAAEVCRGAIAGRRGNWVLATQHLDNARTLAAQIPDSLYKFSLYNRLGIDAINRGDTSAGPRNFLLALDMAERFGTASHRVNILSNLASCQHDLGNDEDAIPLLGEALDIISNDNLTHQQPLVAGNLSMCLLATGKTEEALILVEPYFALSEMDRAEKAFILALGAHACILLSNYDKAQILLDQGHDLAILTEDYEEQMHVWLVKGMLHQALGRTEQALSALDHARELLSYTRNPFYQQQIFKGLANIHSSLGKWESAYTYLHEYQTHFEASSKSARDSRLLMRSLEKEMKDLKKERDIALKQKAARDAENRKLENLNKELTHQIHHVNSMQDTLKEQAIRDHLTGLYNRRHFETCLNAVLHESSGKFVVSVVILDLDFFKNVNDTYGHGFGDEVLVRFAKLVETNLRGSDMMCRYGGEEFCLLLREADGKMAAKKIASIAGKYLKLVIEQGPHRVTGYTFSAGIAEFPLHGTERNELLMRADTALYAAKQAGRNRSAIAEIDSN